MKVKSIILILLIILAAACQNDEFQPSEIESNISPVDVNKSASNGKDGGQAITSEYLDALNEELKNADLNYRIATAEYVTVNSSDEAGQIVFSKIVGNKQLSSDFVPFDPRRIWSGPTDGENDNITYAIDQTGDAAPQFGGLTGGQTDAAIVRATDTWQEVNCSNLDLMRNPDFGIDIGFLAFDAGIGGSPFVFADVQHCGFNIDFAGGILGVTFTLIWVDSNGPTDIDNNGKTDTAFREIYYDASFSWADDGSTNIDVETVAVHEIGHGLSQGHFGTVAVLHPGTPKERLRVSPRAVMNALYTGPYRDLNGTDDGGHCSNWGEWPNN